MSHISNYKIQMTDKNCIVAALKAMGYTVEEGKISAYQEQTADTEFHIKEKKSLGFKKNGEEYELVGDFYRTNLEPKTFVHQLATNYQVEKLKESIPRGWKIDKKENLTNGRIKVVLKETL